MKFAVIFGFVALLVAASVAEEFKCQEGVSYVENECNGCFCTPSGLLGCTEKGCFGPTHTALENCEVGTTYEKECNKCWCAKDIGTICTANKC